MEKLPTAKSPTALQAVKGMNDVLPAESAKWEYFEQTAQHPNYPTLAEAQL